MPRRPRSNTFASNNDRRRIVEQLKRFDPYKMAATRSFESITYHSVRATGAQRAKRESSVAFSQKASLSPISPATASASCFSGTYGSANPLLRRLISACKPINRATCSVSTNESRGCAIEGHCVSNFSFPFYFPIFKMTEFWTPFFRRLHCSNFTTLTN